MNETRSNSRTKPMKGDFKGEEINSLKDSEKTNDILDFIDVIYIYRTKYKTSNKYRNSQSKRTLFAIKTKYRKEFLQKLNKLLNEFSKNKYSK